ncbi:MAG: hypothetical protein IT428_33285 [Planctomycetaceae bacterium]|nr:hypothetical protein [Planctomycetaceae bacterium]
MSVELLFLFAFAMLAAVLGQVGVAGVALANMVCIVTLALFFVAVRVRGVRKPVV